MKPDLPARFLLLDIGRVILDLDYRGFGAKLHALTERGFEEIQRIIRADGLAAQYETGQLDSVQFHREICRRLELNISWEEFVSAWNSIFVPTLLIPEETLNALALKLNLWAVSNTNSLHISYIRNNYSFLECFRGCSLSHEVGVSKPAPGIFRHALENTGAEPGQALFVDDQLENVAAARELGIPAIQFVDYEGFRLELERRSIL